MRLFPWSCTLWPEEKGFGQFDEIWVLQAAVFNLRFNSYDCFISLHTLLYHYVIRVLDRVKRGEFNGLI
ncbi:hypothetical protein Hanom_Chr12g01139511 [Helianthus anomalus]